MSTEDRKSTTSLARALLYQADNIVDCYRTGEISEGQAKARYERAMSQFQAAAYGNFLIRLDNSRFFRDPVPQLDRDASPVSPSDG